MRNSNKSYTYTRGIPVNNGNETLCQDSSSIPLLTESPLPGRAGVGAGDGGGGGSSSVCGVADYRPDEYSIPAHTDEPVVIKKSGVGRAVSLLTTCYSSSEENEMSLSASTRIEDLVPPCYVHAGNMPRLIKVSFLYFLLSPYSYS